MHITGHLTSQLVCVRVSLYSVVTLKTKLNINLKEWRFYFQFEFVIIFLSHMVSNASSFFFANLLFIFFSLDVCTRSAHSLTYTLLCLCICRYLHNVYNVVSMFDYNSLLLFKLYINAIYGNLILCSVHNQKCNFSGSRFKVISKFLREEIPFQTCYFKNTHQHI